MLPAENAVLSPVSDWRIGGLTIVLAVIVGLLTGVGPALLAARREQLFLLERADSDAAHGGHMQADHGDHGLAVFDPQLLHSTVQAGAVDVPELSQ